MELKPHILINDKWGQHTCKWDIFRGAVPSQSGNYFQPAVSKTLTAVCHSGTTASERGTFNTSACPRIPCVPVLGRWRGAGRVAGRSKAQDVAFPTSSRWLRRLQVGGTCPVLKQEPVPLSPLHRWAAASTQPPHQQPPGIRRAELEKENTNGKGVLCKNLPTDDFSL